jgi:spore coat polysaccharide biosynthesis protein SpsF
VIIVQARMGSKRLPGKVMKEINGKPLIGYVLDRTKWCIVTMPHSDRELWDFCFEYVGRGRTLHSDQRIADDDVAGRFASCLREIGEPRWFCRISGDSPLIDPMLVTAAEGLFHCTGARLVSNPHYPQGQRVEVIDTQYFLEREPLMTEPQDREHVTPYLYRNAAPGEWVEFLCNRDMRFDVSMAVDTQADFDRMERVIKRMDRPHTSYNWRECMQLAWEEANG